MLLLLLLSENLLLASPFSLCYLLCCVFLQLPFVKRVKAIYRLIPTVPFVKGLTLQPSFVKRVKAFYWLTPTVPFAKRLPAASKVAVCQKLLPHDPFVKDHDGPFVKDHDGPFVKDHSFSRNHQVWYKWLLNSKASSFVRWSFSSLLLISVMMSRYMECANLVVWRIKGSFPFPPGAVVPQM